MRSAVRGAVLVLSLLACVATLAAARVDSNGAAQCEAAAGCGHEYQGEASPIPADPCVHATLCGAAHHRPVHAEPSAVDSVETSPLFHSESDVGLVAGVTVTSEYAWLAPPPLLPPPRVR